jgi:hypothetical protein
MAISMIVRPQPPHVLSGNNLHFLQQGEKSGWSSSAPPCGRRSLTDGRGDEVLCGIVVVDHPFFAQMRAALKRTVICNREGIKDFLEIFINDY